MGQADPTQSWSIEHLRAHRAQVREVLDWLKSDLFEEERYDGDDKDVRAFRNPGGFCVYLSPRKGRDGLSGWITKPDGTALVVSSRLDQQLLAEYLP